MFMALLGLGRVESFDFWLRCCRGWFIYTAVCSSCSTGQRGLLHQSSDLCWRFVLCTTV